MPHEVHSVVVARLVPMLSLLVSVKVGVEVSLDITVEGVEDLYALVIVMVLNEDSLLVVISLVVGTVLAPDVRISNRDCRDRMVLVGLLGALLTIVVPGRIDKVIVS